MKDKHPLSALTSAHELVVRFNEVDSMDVVWHGHYLNYFESGREFFGNEHGIGYSDMRQMGIMLPVVRVECDYKRPVSYGDRILVETTYQPSFAAKHIFTYRILNSSNGEVVATGRTVQVFVYASNGELMVRHPELITQWWRKAGINTVE